MLLKCNSFYWMYVLKMCYDGVIILMRWFNGIVEINWSVVIVSLWVKLCGLVNFKWWLLVEWFNCGCGWLVVFFELISGSC